MKSVAILGSTGSVGRQTVAVLARNPGQYTVSLLAANQNWREMEKQVRLFKPQFVVMAEARAAGELAARVGDVKTAVLCGQHNLSKALSELEPDLVVAAMVGHQGLLPAVAAARTGADIALANKEALVMAGPLLTALCRKNGGRLLPLDSEHSAIFQCLEGHDRSRVHKIVLTASGGPFHGKSRQQLEGVTPEQAVLHPNWRMGAKISVDSATLMNKGLEVIEARWLFDLQPEQIDVVIHPQSIIHSLVEFCDGSVLAQLGVPSMEVPIQYALSYPDRWPAPAHNFLDWQRLPDLTFAQPDTETFPCLDLARQALGRGGTAPAALTAANDRCVEGFLQGQLGFNAIPEVIAQVLDQVEWREGNNLDDILAVAGQAQALVEKFLKNPVR